MNKKQKQELIAKLCMVGAVGLLTVADYLAPGLLRGASNAASQGNGRRR